MAEQAVAEPPKAEDMSAQDAINSVQKAFDKIFPEKLAKVIVPEKVSPKEPVSPPAETPPSSEKPPEPQKAPEPKLPSFLSETPSAPETPEPAAETLPDELPAEVTDQKVRENWKKARIAHKTEVEKLTKRISDLEAKGKEVPEATTARLQQLEQQNQQMSQILTKVGVETHQKFQQQVIAPLHAAYNEAKNIITTAGGDPKAFDQALGLSGRAQYDALDEVYSALPESAKLEAQDAVRAYRKFNEIRLRELANAPQALERLRQQDLVEQHQGLESQKHEMEAIFDKTVNRYRDNGLEILKPTDDPDSQWWNDIAPQVIQSAKKDFLESQNMEDVSDAAFWRSAGPIYQKLFQYMVKKNSVAQKEIDEVNDAQPTVRDSSGGGAVDTYQEDLKKPFSDVFIKKVRELEGKT